MLPEKDVQFVAICDVRKVRREHVKNLVDKKYGNSDCKMYADMREFLATRSDIDALLIATGDRWHALATIMAMRAGKDVYSEKPSCMTIAEGRAVVQTARRYGRIYQTGTQRLSEANFVAAIELARTGRLGKVHTARAHIAPWDATDMNHSWLPGEPQPPKEEVDWDTWLGPVPGGHTTLPISTVAGAAITNSAQAASASGCAHVRPVPSGDRCAEYVGHRIPVREE